MKKNMQRGKKREKFKYIKERREIDSSIPERENRERGGWFCPHFKSERKSSEEEEKKDSVRREVNLFVCLFLFMDERLDFVIHVSRFFSQMMRKKKVEFIEKN